MLSCFPHVQLLMTPWTVVHQEPLSVGILQARILKLAAIPPPGDLPRDQTRSLKSPALVGRLFTTSIPGKL